MMVLQQEACFDDMAIIAPQTLLIAISPFFAKIVLGVTMPTGGLILVQVGMLGENKIRGCENYTPQDAKKSFVVVEEI